MDKVCNMCGDIGVSEELVTCNRCKKTSEHIYCMNKRRRKMPVLWYCEECLKCRSVIHKETEGKSKKQMIVYGDNSNVKSSEGHGKRSLGVDKNQARNNVVHNGTENKTKKQKVVYGDSNEFNLKSSESPSKRCLRDDKNQTKATDGNTRYCSSKYVMKKQHVGNDKDSKKQELKGIAFCSQTLQLPLPPNRNQDLKLSTSHHAPEACWKGVFKIFEVLYHDYKGIRAHLPCVFCPKVEKISKELSKTIKFEKVLTRRELWPKLFQLDPPTKDDIGLYFFPSEQERFKERYTRLLKRLDDRDFALQACMKDAQLLIFSSNQLPQDSRRIRGERYLWGVFHHLKRKEPSKHTRLKSLSTPTPTKPVDKYMAGHKENAKAYVSISSNMTPPGCISPDSKDFNHVRSSFNKSPLNKVADTADPDIPPGFSEIRPRSSEPVSSRLDVQLDMKFEEVDIVRNNNIIKSDVLIPSIGMPAPDFSKAHSREIDHVKKSFVEFPSNKLADPIDQDAPSGFYTILHPEFSGPPRPKHQDNLCEIMFKGPMLSRIDDKKLVVVPSKKTTIPIDPDVPPDFSKMLQPVSSKHWHSSWETLPSVIVEFPSAKVSNSIDFDVPPDFSKLPPPGFAEPLWSEQRHSSCVTTFQGAIQSSIDGTNCLPSITIEGNISQASKDYDVKPMSPQASEDWYKSSEHSKSKNLTCSLEENRWLYLLGSSKSCTKLYVTSKNLPSSSTLENLCGTSDNHSSLMHRTVKAEMLGDEKLQRKDISIPRIVPDVPPGFSKLLPAGFSEVKTKCPQASDNWCKSAEPPEGSTLICSTEKRESCTKLYPTSDNLPTSSTTENLCGSSDALSWMPKTIVVEMLGDEKIDRRGTSTARVDTVPDSLETNSENRRDASITRADTVPDSLETNLEKNKSPIKFSLKTVDSPIRASVPHCFLVSKTKELEDSSKVPCPSKVNGKDIVSSYTVGSHAAKAPKDCQVQSKCPKATDCGQKSAEHPRGNSPPYHVKEMKGFSSFASPDAHSKHQSIIKNRATSASLLSVKKKAHCELSPSLNLESLSAVKKILLEYKEKRKVNERDLEGLKSENLVCDKENLLSDDKSVASIHESSISLSQENIQMSLVSAFYGSPSIFNKSSANGSKS